MSLFKCKVFFEVQLHQDCPTLCFDFKVEVENNFSSNYNLLFSSKQTSSSLVDRWRLTTH